MLTIRDRSILWRGLRFKLLLAGCGFIGGTGLSAQEPAVPKDPSADEPAATALTPGESDPFAKPPRPPRVLILCGHPGDEEYRTLFQDTLGKLRTGLIERLAIPASQITILSGELPDASARSTASTTATVNDIDPQPAAKPAAADTAANRADEKFTLLPATRGSIAEAVSKLKTGLTPEDSLWVIVLGHTHFDGQWSWLNLNGPDLQQNEFAALFKGVPCREQLFLLTMPASGYYLKPLAAPGRVVISATEADYEVNATLFPIALVEELNRTTEDPLVDQDGDGQLSLLDLYLATSKNVARRFVVDKLLATEHSLLEDNGDGKGAELQQDYLTVEEGGRLQPDRPKTLRPQPAANRGAAHPDGTLAAKIRLNWTPAPAPPSVPGSEKRDEAKPDAAKPDGQTPAGVSPDQKPVAESPAKE